MSSNPSPDIHLEFNQDSVSKCLKFVEDFKKGLIQKGDALLEIQAVLHTAIDESELLSQRDFKPGFKHYLELLDQASNSNEFKPIQGRPTIEEEPHREKSVRSEESESFAIEKNL
ncbi:hypothetical protein BDR03DRAFT_982783 [Suillus americanus]|nr:hypothetical protein BDR03DRAFT_982783 [Suillus americanus]